MDGHLDFSMQMEPQRQGGGFIMSISLQTLFYNVPCHRGFGL